MGTPLDGFDFGALDGPEFKEDSVRRPKGRAHAQTGMKKP